MRSQRELAFQKVNFSFFGHRNLFLGLISVAQDGKFRIRMEEAGGGRYNEKQITRQCFQRRSSGKFRLNVLVNSRSRIHRVDLYFAFLISFGLPLAQSLWAVEGGCAEVACFDGSLHPCGFDCQAYYYRLHGGGGGNSQPVYIGPSPEQIAAQQRQNEANQLTQDRASNISIGKIGPRRLIPLRPPWKKTRATRLSRDT